MRHIDRLPEPDILARKGKEWLASYEKAWAADHSKRPDASKYRHKDIVATLINCSFNKCFYCETMLSDIKNQVEHFVEVAIDHTKAYEWTNLYLSCADCNCKLDHNKVPVDMALDPCRDSDEEIGRNLTFDRERAVSVAGSVKGPNTIRKFRLNEKGQPLRRSKWLRHIAETVIEIQENMNSQGRQSPTDEERELLRRFMQPDQPYTLMSTVYLNRIAAHLL